MNSKRVLSTVCQGIQTASLWHRPPNKDGVIMKMYGMCLMQIYSKQHAAIFYLAKQPPSGTGQMFPLQFWMLHIARSLLNSKIYRRTWIHPRRRSGLYPFLRKCVYIFLYIYILLYNKYIYMWSRNILCELLEIVFEKKSYIGFKEGLTLSLNIGLLNCYKTVTRPPMKCKTHIGKITSNQGSSGLNFMGNRVCQITQWIP